MPFPIRTMQTVLGRRVRQGDWRAHEEDTVLRMLWGYWRLRDGSYDMDVSFFANALNVEPKEALKVCNRLIAQQRIVPGREKGSFRISERGKNEVDALRRRTRST